MTKTSDSYKSNQ